MVAVKNKYEMPNLPRTQKTLREASEIIPWYEKKRKNQRNIKFLT